MITQTRTFTVKLGTVEVPLSEDQLRALKHEIELILGNPAPRVTGAVARVCRHFGVDEQRLLSPDRSDLACVRRWFVFYLLSQEKFPSKVIGKELRVNDSTVRHGLRQLRNRLEYDKWTQETWNKLQAV